MMLWIFLAVLTMAVLGLLAWPLLKNKPAAIAGRAEYDLRVFGDQLKEVERDVEAGLLAAEQAEAARTEIKRRILAAGQAKGDGEGKGLPRNALAAGLVVLVPAAAFALYGAIGSPAMPDQPHDKVQQARLGVDHDGAKQIEAMVESLAARLQQKPDDPEGWAMYGRSLKTLGRLEESIDAFQRAVDLTPKPSADLLGSLAETMVAASNGMVVPEARALFLQALDAWDRDPRSRFFLGLARAQVGDGVGAIAVWKDLEADSNPDVPWLAVLREQIQKVAVAAKLDPSKIEPKGEKALRGSAAPGAAAGSGMPDLAAAMSVPVAPQGPAQAQANNAEVSPEVLAKRIADLAARLEKQPGDADGWFMLGRSYKALREPAKAKDAFAKAAAAKPKDMGLKMAYAESILAVAPDQDDLPAEFVTVMKDVLALEPLQADALYYVGLSEAQAGRKGEARKLWNTLLGTLKPGSEEHLALEQEIKDLGPAK